MRRSPHRYGQRNIELVTCTFQREAHSLITCSLARHFVTSNIRTTYVKTVGFLCRQLQTIALVMLLLFTRARFARA